MTWQQTLGEQIRTARKGVGLTQEQLGKAIEKTRNMIGRYESGSDAPPVDVLGKIALQLGMTGVNVNGFHFVIAQQPRSQADPQLRLDFNKEYSYSGATLTIKPNKVTITITVAALEPAIVVSG